MNSSNEASVKVNRKVSAYIVHNARPALHRNALKDGQHRQTEVVEVRDAPVGPDPLLVAHPAALGGALEALAAGSRHVHRERI